jgi:hypothetical protein
MKIIFTLCLLYSHVFAFGQTGFFLLVDKGSCERSAVALDNKQKYCITEEPIIKQSEFKIEGELQNYSQTQTEFFNLRFTKSGFETLKLICDRMPEKKLVFVVKGRAVGTYDGKNLRPRQVIQISGKSDSKEIRWVLENLR